MIGFIDNLLNRITMYRLMLYYLVVLIAAAIVFGALGVLPYSPLSLIVSAGIILSVGWIVNEGFAKIFRIPANAESVYITAFILTLIIPPWTGDFSGFLFLVLASCFAMASKYILAFRRKHIFNPAAIAAVITAFALNQYASWWAAGNLPMLAFVVVGGLLIVRKIQRFDLVLSFFAAAIVSIIVVNPSFNPIATAEKALLHTTLLFFAFVMLTEPLTTPPTRARRIAYGLLVGALFAPGIHVGTIYSTPELALVVGNLFSFAVSPKGRYRLTLQSKQKIGDDIYDLAFRADKKIQFRPGQYMAWTLPPKGSDTRGNRRYFTLASSPTESDVRLGVKYYEPPSTFKKKMVTLEPGETISAAELAGDFTLPADPNQKLLFIAGGIGITPFRSMVKYLVDRGEKRDIVLLYSNRLAREIAYAPLFDEAAQKVGLKIVYVVTDQGARIDMAMIKKEAPDYAARLFYVSGPYAMISAFKKTLREIGVPPTQIKTDFFPGFA